MTPSQLASPRIPPVVYLLAVVIFCLGTSEFMIAGLLEPISADLHVGIPQAGLLITGFAVGMIVGAPLMALLTLKLPRRATMILMIIVFSLVHVLAALAPSYSVLMLSRVVSAIACGGFWAVAAVHTTRVTPVEAHGRALASLVGGLTVANLLGVPLGTWVGAQFGWRATFWLIAIITAVAGVLIALMVRSSQQKVSGLRIPEILKAETAAFKGPRIWLALGTTALFQASVFAAFSYFSPLLTRIAGIPYDLVPVVLAAFGVGAFVGVVIGGRLADRNVFGNIVGSLVALALSLVLLWVVVDIAWAAIVMIVLIGVSGFSIAGALNARVFQIATEAPTLAASVNTSAFNVGNALGPALGAAVIAAGWGFRAPILVAIGLALAALVVVYAAIVKERSLAPGRQGPPAADEGPAGEDLRGTPRPGPEAVHPSS